MCLQTRIRVRVVCTRAYHALFMHNMMIRPSEEELATFGEPDFTIYNAGALLQTTPLDGISRNSSTDAAGSTMHLYSFEQCFYLLCGYQFSCSCPCVMESACPRSLCFFLKMILMNLPVDTLSEWPSCSFSVIWGRLGC